MGQTGVKNAKVAWNTFFLNKSARVYPGESAIESIGKYGEEHLCNVSKHHLYQC